jgi:hypothetical protein
MSIQLAIVVLRTVKHLFASRRVTVAATTVLTGQNELRSKHSGVSLHDYRQYHHPTPPSSPRELERESREL